MLENDAFWTFLSEELNTLTCQNKRAESWRAFRFSAYDLFVRYCVALRRF